MGTGGFPFFMFLLTAIVAWVVVGLVYRHVSGWASLAKRYRCDEEFSGNRLRFRSARMRYWTGYGNCLTMGVNARGFFLSLSIPVFPGFPPLFIPWNETGLRRTSFLLTKYVELHLGSGPAIPFRIFEGLAAKLAAPAGEAWPKESEVML
jgi:hypothetical protein